MRVVINRERAVQVLDTLYAQFLAKKFPYNTREGQVPQLPENMPRKSFSSPRDHACFLFTLCLYMRGKVKSDTATRGMSRIYEQHPYAFRPETAHLLDRAWLVQILKNSGLGVGSKESARFWIENMRRLHEYWNGDPRAIFADATSYEQLAGRICNAKTRRKRHTSPEHLGFQGFQLKMTSMIIYYLLDAKLIEPLRFPVPVDFHVMRIFIAHEAVVVVDGNGNHRLEAMQDALREFSTWYCKTKEIDDLRMSEFIWCFSRAICARHPGNKSKYIGPRNRRGIIVANPVTWSKGQQRSYNLACGQCPIEPTCKHCVPAAPYYNYGQLVIRDRRDTPPQKRLYPPTREVIPEKKPRSVPQNEKPPVPDIQEVQTTLKFR